ncbi:MAG: hypothetical protein ACKV2O_14450 [Acidimicrobiales bacterium]
MGGVRLGPYPVVLPRLGDPRLAQSAVLLSVQALGQSVLGFPLSVPQILISLATCALMELSMTFLRYRLIMWPASALLTGNGVALLLRHPGTGPDQPWATGGLGLFAGVAALAMVTKYLIRWRGRHLFNPSNAGLLVAMVVLGSQRADLQVLYWGRFGPSLAVALTLIVVGAVVVTRRAGVSAITVAYLLSLGAGLAVLAASGHCIAASWHPVPLCNGELWWRIMSSPETLIFAAFMVTDPKTVPDAAGARVAFGALTGLGSVLLAAPATTEFATKVALLGGLTLACGAVAALRMVAASPLVAGLGTRRWPRPVTVPRRGGWLFGMGLAGGAVACTLILLLGRSARSVTLAAGGPGTVTASAPDSRPPQGPSPALTRPPQDVAPAAPRSPTDADATVAGGDGDGDGDQGRLPPWPPGIEAPPVVIEPDVAAWAPWFAAVDAEHRARALVGDLEARRGRGEEPAARYVEVTVLMVRVPGSPQDSPEIGFRVQRRLEDGVERTDLYRLTSWGSSFVIAGTAQAWSG